MARLVALDSGTVGLLTHPRGNARSSACRTWLVDMTRATGVALVLPAIIDFEHRRALLARGATAQIRLLDDLRSTVTWIPIDDDSLALAARLWADARKRGVPTSSDRSLDVDTILAAQCLGQVGDGDTLTMATGNARHLGTFPGIEARPWEGIEP